MGNPPFVDLHHLSEDKRIDLIGQQAIDHMLVVGFIVDMEGIGGQDKADRYISKLQKKYPTIRIVHRGPGPTPHTILVKVGPPLQ